MLIGLSKVKPISIDIALARFESNLMYLIAVIGPFMILPNVGLNEWGHTFWFMEELFVAPLHYGFVFFGWAALAVMGVVNTEVMAIKIGRAHV